MVHTKTQLELFKILTKEIRLEKPDGVGIILKLLLRLGAQSVTLLSTLRDPTQPRRRQCASKKQHPLFLFPCDV